MTAKSNNSNANHFQLSSWFFPIMSNKLKAVTVHIINAMRAVSYTHLRAHET